MLADAKQGRARISELSHSRRNHPAAFAIAVDVVHIAGRIVIQRTGKPSGVQ
jgi:hypothetical protein